jgi:hypothetical protein
MSSKKKGRPGGVQGGQLVQMLDRQRAQQAAEDAAKKSALATRNLVDAFLFQLSQGCETKPVS